MSWGTTEFFGESTYDSVFTTLAEHTGVTFVAATGDSGAWYGLMYPAASPNVLAVGGTSLQNLDANGDYPGTRRNGEVAWSGSGGGISQEESEPSYQDGVQSTGYRTDPDVSFNANPNTGVAVYDSVPFSSGQSGWFQVGGTSAGTPAWAGLVAIADQGLGGKGPLSSTQAQTDLYSLPSSDFHDITIGSNGYYATSGYNLVTGLGGCP